MVPHEEPVEPGLLGRDAEFDQPGGFVAEIGHRDAAEQAFGHPCPLSAARRRAPRAAALPGTIIRVSSDGDRPAALFP